MNDLVVTCPMTEWADWLAEGDCAGDPPTGREYEWFMGKGGRRPRAGVVRSVTEDETIWEPMPGQRIYIVAFGRLRGYAPLVRLVGTHGSWILVRGGDAAACTLAEPIPGFRGWRYRWWDRGLERPFPNWKTEGVR